MVDLQELIALELTRYEAAAYLCLLEWPGMAQATVAARAGVLRQRVYDLLDSLATKGPCLAREGGPGRLSLINSSSHCALGRPIRTASYQQTKKSGGSSSRLKMFLR
ncbi:helix-turn-helix domain-containing protein [Solidesulfovibrio sp.]|uniref:helix-turn-helix domain-containing protein n=1 Tax=Solidesulfovibrio sp. TaxID=2910990 RepID=UPI00260F5787|nr:helix-turn-helix domain-containing protein [Solidesulfovibrio sp.]